MQTGIYVPVQDGSPPTREGEGILGEVVRLTLFTFSKPRPHSYLSPSTQLNKKLLSLSRNLKARISGCCVIGLCQAKPSTKENRDVCWSLDSRKSKYSSTPCPQGFSGHGPSFPLASIDLHACPNEWELILCLCPLGNLGAY